MRRHRGTRPIAAIAAVIALAPVHALAQAGEPLRASLAIAPADRTAARCLDGADLASRVEDILGRDVIRDPPARLHIEVAVRRDELATLAVVRLIEDGVVADEREVVHAGRCRALAGPLSVVLAMLLDDLERAAQLDVSAVAPEPEPPPPPAVAPAPVSQPPAQAARPIEAPREEPWSTTIAVGGTLAIGFLPGPAAGGPELRGRTGPRGGFAGLASLSVLPWAEATGAPGGEFSGFFGALGVCTPRFADARPLFLEGCAAVGGGAIRGAGTAIAHTYERFEAWLDVQAFFEVGWALAAPVALTLRVGALVPILRPLFYVRIDDHNVRIHEPWPVVPVVGLALELGDTP